MKIAISHTSRSESFSSRFEDYCQRNNIEYVLVDCTSDSIIHQLENCDALVWHWPHANHKFEMLARQLTYSLETAGKVVFPNSKSCWHFDDKVGQKYLMEALGLPLVPSHVFYDSKTALDFLARTEYPVVFKLRGGAGSQNVKLIKNYHQGKKMVKRMFSRGYPLIDWLDIANDRWKKYQHHLAPFRPVLSALKLALRSTFSTQMREYGYMYCQKFIPGNKFDIRAIVIGDKVFEIKRQCRAGDFRASGSGMIFYEKEDLSEECAQIALHAAEKMQTQCVAFDFVFDNGKPLLVECSYGFAMHGYDRCSGYWDAQMQWHPGHFNPQDWIMDLVIKEIKIRNR